VKAVLSEERPPQPFFETDEMFFREAKNNSKSKELKKKVYGVKKSKEN